MQTTSYMWLHLFWQQTQRHVDGLPRCAANSVAGWQADHETVPILFASTGCTSHCLLIARSDQSPSRVIEAMSRGGMTFRLPDGSLFAPLVEGPCSLFPVAAESILRVASTILRSGADNRMYAE
jgi:hypothetical protein